MKIIKALLLLFLVSTTLLANDFEFDVTPLSCDFLGAVKFNERVILYGTNGMTLYSEDNCQTWEQETIGRNNYNILKMKKCDQQLIGLLSHGWVVSSTDGEHWSWHFITDKPFLDFDYYDGKIYVLDYDSIIVCKDFNVEAKFALQHDTLDEFSKEIKISNGKAVVASSSTKLEIYDLATYDLERSIQILPQSYSSTHILAFDGNKMDLTIGNMYLRTSDTGISWDTLGLNIYASAIYNDKIYGVSYSNDYYRDGWTTFNFKTLNSPKLWDTISTTIYKEFANYLNFTGIQFLDSSNIVIYGRNKHISFSTDAGKTWQLKCLLNKPTRSKWFSDAVGVAMSEDNVFHTTDGGCIWLPHTPKGEMLTAINNKNTSQTENKYMYIDSNQRLVILCGYYNGVSAYTSLDSGQTLFPYFEGWTSLDNTYTDYAVCDWKGNKAIASIGVYITTINFINPDMKGIGKPRYCKDKLYGIGYYADKFYLVSSHDDMVITGKDTTDYEVYSLFVSSDTCHTWTKLQDLGSFKSSGNIITRSSANFVDNKLIWISYENIGVNDEKGLFEWKYSEYKLPEGEKIVDCIVDTSNNSSYLPYTKYKDYLVYWGNSEIVYHKTYDPVCQWTKIPYTGYNTGFEYYDQKYDDIWGYHHIYGYDYFLGLVRLTHNPPVSVQDPKDEAKSDDELIIYSPYPSPADSYLRAVVYWQGNTDMTKANINIFNSNGEKVAGNSDTKFSYLSSNHGILEWNCQSATPGVYLIYINTPNASKTIRAVVNR